jgi:stress-induced morphogen
MPLAKSVVQSMIEDALPGASVDIIDIAGDNDHYQAVIEARQFKGLSKIAQHQLVYSAFKGKMGTELHALSLTTKVKEAE